MATLQVFPNKSGGWHWTRDNKNKSSSFETRREAIDAARAEKQPGDNVVLLRTDGSVYGELDHAVKAPGGQDVTLEFAGETGGAGAEG